MPFLQCSSKSSRAKFQIPSSKSQGNPNASRIPKSQVPNPKEIPTLPRVQKRREDAHRTPKAPRNRVGVFWILHEVLWSAAVLRRFRFHLRVYYFPGIWVLGFGIYCLKQFGIWNLLPLRQRQCPRPKIIQEDQPTAVLLCTLAFHEREIGQWAELKSCAQWAEEIVLVAR